MAPQMMSVTPLPFVFLFYENWSDEK